MPSVWKQVLAPGTYCIRGKFHHFSPEDVKHLVREGKEMVKAGLPIRVPEEHQSWADPYVFADDDERKAKEVEYNKGFVEDFALDKDGTAWTKLGIPDPNTYSRLKTEIKFVSPRILPGFTDGEGTTWGKGKGIIAHVALTPTPVWHKQKPFGARMEGPIALSQSDVVAGTAGVLEPLEFSLADRVDVGAMPATDMGVALESVLGQVPLTGVIKQQKDAAMPKEEMSTEYKYPPAKAVTIPGTQHTAITHLDFPGHPDPGAAHLELMKHHLVEAKQARRNAEGARQRATDPKVGAEIHKLHTDTAESHEAAATYHRQKAMAHGHGFGMSEAPTIEATPDLPTLSGGVAMSTDLSNAQLGPASTAHPINVFREHLAPVKFKGASVPVKTIMHRPAVAESAHLGIAGMSPSNFHKAMASHHANVAAIHSSAGRHEDAAAHRAAVKYHQEMMGGKQNMSCAMCENMSQGDDFSLDGLDLAFSEEAYAKHGHPHEYLAKTHQHIHKYLGTFPYASHGELQGVLKSKMGTPTHAADKMIGRLHDQGFLKKNVSHGHDDLYSRPKKPAIPEHRINEAHEHVKNYLREYGSASPKELQYHLNEQGFKTHEASHAIRHLHYHGHLERKAPKDFLAGKPVGHGEYHLPGHEMSTDLSHHKHFVQQNHPAKVKEVYKALEREHPEYSAGKKARIANAVGGRAAEEKKADMDMYGNTTGTDGGLVGEDMSESGKKIAKREDRSPEKGEHEYGDVAFADPTNKAYPVSSPEKVRAAWGYIHHAHNAGKYSEKDVESIKSRIRAAAKKYGIELESPEEEKKDMSESSGEMHMTRYHDTNVAIPSRIHPADGQDKEKFHNEMAKYHDAEAKKPAERGAVNHIEKQHAHLTAAFHHQMKAWGLHKPGHGEPKYVDASMDYSNSEQPAPTDLSLADPGPDAPFTYNLTTDLAPPESFTSLNTMLAEPTVAGPSDFSADYAPMEVNPFQSLPPIAHIETVAADMSLTSQLANFDKQPADHPINIHQSKLSSNKFGVLTLEDDSTCDMSNGNNPHGALADYHEELSWRHESRGEYAKAEQHRQAERFHREKA